MGGRLFTAPVAATTDCRGWVDECSSAVVDYDAAAIMCLRQIMLSIVILLLLRIGSFDGVESAKISYVSTAFGVRGQLPLSHKEYAGERSHCCAEECRLLRRSLV